MGVTTRKIIKKWGKGVLQRIHKKDIDTLTKEKSNDIRKYNIMNILNNVGSIFTDLYWHYCKDVPKETKRSIAERIKLRKKGLHEIKGTEQNINNELYKSPYFTIY